jgi:iron complex transport system ATP-binding protein
MDSIETKKLAVAYDEKLVLDDLCMRIPQGRITAIIGPNGCGKSTILKAIGRILKPQSGLVYLNGDDIRSLSTREVAQRMAILPQAPQAPEGLTVGELVAYGRFPHQRGMGRLDQESKRVITWALEATRLADDETTTIDSLSGGQRQRAWIAMALAQQTDLILLDEPTTYLDLAYQLEILELLHNLNRGQGRTIIMVLHDINLAARFSDYMIAVRSGAIIQHGTPEVVVSANVLGDTFHIDAEIGPDPRTGRPICISYDLKHDPCRYPAPLVLPLSEGGVQA